MEPNVICWRKLSIITYAWDVGFRRFIITDEYAFVVAGEFVL